MNSIISEQVEKLFDEAVVLSETKRETFLDVHCGSNSDLRNDVVALLAASDLADSYFTTLGKQLGLESIFNGDLELPQNKTIGAYRLIKLIGRGGMGAVYLAERSDKQFEKKVALKILPIGISGENSLHNFLAERQILARLEHSNIARLLDGGIAEHNTPYFVMDYVDGVPIDEHCDIHSLNLEQRLVLFLQVADAVEYAHRNLIVHRDIKPGNILVDKSGVVKLVDFGIAKLLEPDADAAPIIPLADRAMTLIYSSPESISGGTVTTGMDVYSLGILLYKLLTGGYPYSKKMNNSVEIHKQILESLPLLPSKFVLENNNEASQLIASCCSTNIKGLAQKLAGDLDSIITMALRKKPENRYRSVEQFIADLRMYQRQLPVIAQAPTLFYRFNKFVRRRSSMVASAAIMILLLCVISVLATQYVITTKEQSLIIAKERDTAIQIRDFLITIFETSHPDQTRNETVTARELLDKGAAKIKNELTDTPELQAVLMTTIGDVYNSRTLFEQAKTQYTNALNLYRQTHGELSIPYTSTLHRVAEIAEQLGDYKTALSLAKQALELNEKIEHQQGIADALSLMGRTSQRVGKLADVEELFQRALSIQRNVFGNNHESVAVILESLGNLRYQQQNLEDARTLQLEALNIRRALYGEDALVNIGNLYALGNISRKQQHFTEAKYYYKKALNISTKLVPEGSADTVFMYNGLGKVHEDLEEYDQAEINYKKSAETSSLFYGERHPNRAFALSNLGEILIKKEQFEKSELVLQEALSIAEEKIPGHPMLHRLKVNLGASLATNGNYARAKKLIREGYQHNIESEKPSKKLTVFALKELIKLYSSQQNHVKAEEFYLLLDQKQNISNMNNPK